MSAEELSQEELARTATPEMVSERIVSLKKRASRGTKRALDAATAVHTFAIMLFRVGRARLAEAAFNAVLPVFRNHAPPASYAVCLLNRSAALDLQGQYTQAVAGYDVALPLLKRYALTSFYAQGLMNRACSLNSLCKYEESVAGHDAALPMLEQFATPDLYGICLMNRSNALSSLGRHNEAVAGYDYALPILKQYATPTSYARCLMNRADSVRAQGRYEEAVAGFDRALSILKEHGTPATIANCLIQRANALGVWGQHMEAVAAYDVALPLIKEHGELADYACGLANRASALYELNSYQASCQGYADARRVARQARRYAGVDDTCLEFNTSYGGLYQVAVRAGLKGRMSDDAYDAVREGKAGVYDDITFKLKSTRRDEPPAVMTARNDLTQWLRRQAPELPDKPEPTEADVQKLGAQVARFREGRDQRTRLYLSEWGQHTHAYDASRNVVPSVEDLPTRAEVQKELPARWALVDFWLTGDDEFHAFVLTRDDFEVVKLPRPLEAKQAMLTRLRRDLLTLSDAEPNLDGLSDLGNWLFKPLLPALRAKEIKGLYLVPHNLLHLFPLHAAKIGAKYLCDVFDVAYLPSANLLPKLPKPDASGPAFVLANPEVGTDHDLPRSHWEGIEVRDVFDIDEDKCFIGKCGTLAATDAWADCGYVHISCHGSGDTQFAPLSHLRLADDLLLAHDILVRKPQLKTGAVVVLNGCETSVTDLRAVNESMGLMTAYLMRGAGAVFSTMWSVNDNCAALMGKLFAEQIRAGADVATAMKEARAAVRGMSRPDLVAAFRDHRGPKQSLPAWVLRAEKPFDNPVFWGAFQLVGRVV